LKESIEALLQDREKPQAPPPASRCRPRSSSTANDGRLGFDGRKRSSSAPSPTQFLYIRGVCERPSRDSYPPASPSSPSPKGIENGTLFSAPPQIIQDALHSSFILHPSSLFAPLIPAPTSPPSLANLPNLPAIPAPVRRRPRDESLAQRRAGPPFSTQWLRIYHYTNSDVGRRRTGAGATERTLIAIAARQSLDGPGPPANNAKARAGPRAAWWRSRRPGAWRWGAPGIDPSQGLAGVGDLHYHLRQPRMAANRTVGEQLGKGAQSSTRSSKKLPSVRRRRADDQKPGRRTRPDDNKVEIADHRRAVACRAVRRGAKFHPGNCRI